MKKQETFNNNWKEFLANNLTERPPEKIEGEELARLFFEIGFSAGALE